MQCTLNKVGLSSQASSAISIDAAFVAFRRLAMAMNFNKTSTELAFRANRSRNSLLNHDAEGCKRLFMWHKDQKAVCCCLMYLTATTNTVAQT